MKKFFATAIIINCAFAFAQKTDENYAPVQYKNQTCVSSFQKIKLNGEANVQSIQQYLKEHLLNLKDYRTGLRLNYVHESPGGFHFSFMQTFNGIEVYQSEIKVNLDRQNVIHSVFDNCHIIPCYTTRYLCSRNCEFSGSLCCNDGQAILAGSKIPLYYQNLSWKNRIPVANNFC